MPDMQPIGGLSRWSGWLSAFAMVCRCRRQRPVPAWNLFSTAALKCISDTLIIILMQISKVFAACICLVYFKYNIIFSDYFSATGILIFIQITRFVNIKIMVLQIFLFELYDSETSGGRPRSLFSSGSVAQIHEQTP